MRISKVLAVAAAGCALAAAVALPATAVASHGNVASKTKQFKSTLNHHTARPGETLVLKGHGAKKSTSYTCVLIVIKGTAYDIDTGSLKPVKSTSKGKITCRQKYEPYTATSLSGGPPLKCPAAKGYRCAMAVSTTNKKSATIQYFKGKK